MCNSISEFLLFSISFAIFPLPIISLLNYWCLVLGNCSTKDINFQNICGLCLNGHSNYIAAISRITGFNLVVIVVLTLVTAISGQSRSDGLSDLIYAYNIWLVMVVSLSLLVIVGRAIGLCAHRDMDDGHVVALRAWIPMVIVSSVGVGLLVHFNGWTLTSSIHDHLAGNSTIIDNYKSHIINVTQMFKKTLGDVTYFFKTKLNDINKMT